MPGTAQGLDLAYGERWPCQPLAHLPCDTAKLWLISETVGSKVGCGQERHQRSGLGVWDSHPNRRDALPRCAGLRTCFFHGQQRELFPRSFPGHVYGPLLQQAEKAANISRPNATPPACARAKKVFSSFYKKCGNGFHGLSSLGTPETPPPLFELGALVPLSAQEFRWETAPALGTSGRGLEPSIPRPGRTSLGYFLWETAQHSSWDTRAFSWLLPPSRECPGAPWGTPWSTGSGKTEKELTVQPVHPTGGPSPPENHR